MNNKKTVLLNATLTLEQGAPAGNDTEKTCEKWLLTLISVMAMSTTLPTTIKASNVFHASAK